MAAEKKSTALATVDSFQIVTGMEGMRILCIAC